MSWRTRVAISSLDKSLTFVGIPVLVGDLLLMGSEQTGVEDAGGWRLMTLTGGSLGLLWMDGWMDKNCLVKNG